MPRLMLKRIRGWVLPVLMLGGAARFVPAGLFPI